MTAKEPDKDIAFYARKYATSSAFRMTRVKAKSADAWVQLGQAYIKAGQTQSAPNCFARATQLEPQNSIHWARLGKVLLSLREYKAAEDALRQACVLEPTSARLQTLLGYVLRDQNDIDGALAAYAHARRVEPDDLHSAVAEALLLPPVYHDTSEVRRWRARFEDGLVRLRGEQSKTRSWATQILDLEWENFHLAHQGGNDRELQQLYAEFLDAALAHAVPHLQSPMGRSPTRGRKIRVGFLSSELRSCTIGDYFSSWILDLPRDRFEVRCYFTGHLRDELTAKLAAGCDHFESLGGRVDVVGERVRADALDLILFPDIGLTAQSYLLANLRLAPIQCAAWGHPVTTGSRHIDHVISCAEMEPPDAAQHYREQLILLPGLGTRYERPARPVERSRSYFGLPQDAHIYTCPNRMHKILPDSDEFLVEILAQDAKAVLVFFDAVAPGQRQAFLERLQRAMAARGIAPRQQLKVLPMLPHDEFRGALALADVMLDTSNFSAGSSALDALAVGLPIIVTEGRYMRGRQSAAMLRIVGVPELVVQDARLYVEQALRVATDRPYRSSLSDRIIRGLPRLFERGEPLAALAAGLSALVS